MLYSLLNYLFSGDNRCAKLNPYITGVACAIIINNLGYSCNDLSQGEIASEAYAEYPLTANPFGDSSKR